MTIAGTTIGAGFASGREIWEFFAVYGGDGIQGIALFAGLFTLCCYWLLVISWQAQGSSYVDVLSRFLPPRMVRVYDGLMLVYLFSLTVVMFAASGAVFQSHSRPFTAGVLLMATVVFGGLLYNVQGLLIINSWVTPLLVLMLAAVSMNAIVDDPTGGERFGGEGTPMPTMAETPVIGGQPPYGVWASAIVYTAFNLLPMVGVLSTAAQTCARPRQLLLGSGLGGLMLGMLAALVFGALRRLPQEAGAHQEILLFDLVAALPFRIDGLVSLILWLAIFTTALSSMYGLTARLSALTAVPYSLVVGGLVFLIVPCSYFGFATLVKILYPIYGIASLFFVGCLLLYPLQETGRRDASTPPARW